MTSFRPVKWWEIPALLMLFGFGVAACGDDTYQPRVICHNANCQEPADPENDSLMDSFERSMDLEVGDPEAPPFDGVEIDTFWWAESNRCLMAHDLDRPDDTVDAHEVIDHLNERLEQRIDDELPITRYHDEFTVLIELKDDVSEHGDSHSAGERRLHAECVVEMAQSAIDAADANGYSVEIIYMSFAPGLLVEVAEVMDDQLDAGDHPVRLSALQGIRRPVSDRTLPLDEYPDDIGIDLVSTHPQWLAPGDLDAYASRGWDLGFWSFNLTPDILDAIRRYEPDYVTTSQAPSLAGWLDTRN